MNKLNLVYFQPPDIKKEYCEVGLISKSDPRYIVYLNEPCRVLITDVKIIDKEYVIYDKKNKLHKVVKNNTKYTNYDLNGRNDGTSL